MQRAPSAPPMDVFSFGVMACQLLTTHGSHSLSWWRELNTSAQAREGVWEALNLAGIPSELALLVADCLHLAVERRVTMDALASEIGDLR